MILNRLQWATKFEGNIVDKIKSLNLKDNQGVVTYEYSSLLPLHRIDCIGDRVVIARMYNGEVKYTYREAGFIPIYVGKIVSFDDECVNHIIGDLYTDTKHLQKFWSMKRKLRRFLYKINWYYRWKIKKRFEGK